MRSAVPKCSPATLALAGQLKYSHLYFAKPHYGSGLVVSASFSNELEE